MPDDLPGFSKDTGAGKPLTKTEFAKRERERKALEVYRKTYSYPKVREALKLRDNATAKKVVSDAWNRYQAEEDLGAGLYRYTMREGLQELEVLLMEMSRDGNLAAMDRVLKVWERMAKLEDLDKRKDAADGPQVVVIDSRPPWLRGETIDGEADDDPPTLPAKT